MNRQSDKLPAGWKWAKLGDVCMVNPRRPTGFDWDPHTKTTFVPMPSVDGQTGAITQPQERIFAEVSRGYTYFEEGDVLFAKITPCMQNGKHAIASGLGNGFGFGSTEFHVLRPSGAVLSEWVHKFLRQPSVLAEAVHHFRGSVGQQRVPKEYLHSLQIPLPPLTEQKRIAALLNQQMAYVEKARKAAEEMLEAAQALPGAFLRQAFPAHGDALPAGWKLRCLCDLCTYDRKTVTPSNPLAQTLAYIGLENVESNSGRIMLNTGDSSSGQVKGNSYRFDARHVLYSKLRPYLNKVVLPEFSGRCSTELIPLLPGPIDREYLAWYLRRPETVYYAMRSKTGSRMPRTDMKAFMQMPVLLPPLSEQKRIAALLKEQMAYVETVRMSASEQLDAINALPAALLRRAFAGTL